MAEKFSLKDHLFNADTLGQLAAEYAAGLPGFHAQSFLDAVLPGLPDRELMARMDWIADCIALQLSPDFPTMADELEAAMPAPLDPSLRDDDFGHFIHAVPGILAVRHGLEDHRDRALDLLHAATKRFSMEFYIRAFLDRWPDETLARLTLWTDDPNYHVRRLVSEGTRARLPWAQRLKLDPMVPLKFIHKLHADPTRYVTRSVANHLNDIAKLDADVALAAVDAWHDAGQQTDKELAWMTSHALRTLIKDGHPGAMARLGYRPDAPVTLEAFTVTPQVAIGDAAALEIVLTAAEQVPVLVDYIMHFKKSDGSLAPKVFKLKQAKITPGKPLKLKKSHRFKGDATTFRLYPGGQEVSVQVNGRVLGTVPFTLIG